MAITKPNIVFCEDIREESFGKFSLLGVLGSAIAPAEQTAEFSLPRFAICVLATVENENTIPVRLEVVSNPPTILPPLFEIVAQNENPDELIWDLRINAIINDLKLMPGTRITVNAFVGDQVTRSSVEFRAFK